MIYIRRILLLALFPLLASAQTNVFCCSASGSGGWASEAANLVWASPDGMAGNPLFRSLVMADLPAEVVTTDTTQTITADKTLLGLVTHGAGDPDLVYDARMLRVYDSPTITTTGPTMVIDRSETIDVADCGNNPDESVCNSGLYVRSRGPGSAGTMGIHAIMAAATLYDPAGVRDSWGVVTRAINNGFGIGGGLYAEGYRSSVNGRSVGAEITSWNGVTTDCTFNPSDFNPCQALWVASRGTSGSDNSTGIAIGGFIGSAFSRGIHLLPNSVIHTSFYDNSTSTNSIHIDGGHTYALITGATAGKVGIGNVTPFSALSNSSANVFDAGGTGTSQSALLWATSGVGYAATITNADATAATRNGLLVKTAATDAASFPLKVDTGSTTKFSVDGAGKATFTAGAGSGTMTPVGLMTCSSAIAQTTAVTTPETLFSYSVPGNTLNTIGGIRLRLWGSTGANTNVKTIRVKWGASTTTINNVTTAPNGTAWKAETEIQRITATSQYMFTDSKVASTAQTMTVIAPSETLSGAVTLAVEGQNGTAVAGDITLFRACVEKF